MNTERKQRAATKTLRKRTVSERLFQLETIGSLTTLALFGYATDPDLADRAVELALDYLERQTGKRIGKRERSRYREEMVLGTQQRVLEPGYAHHDPAIVRAAIAYALDLGVTFGFEEPKPEPTDPAVMIQAEPATQTIQ